MSNNVKCVVIQPRRIKRIRTRRIITRRIIIGGVDRNRRATVDRALLPGRHRRRRTAAAAHHHGQAAAAEAAVAEAAVTVKITK